jgi:hypothetical protein
MRGRHIARGEADNFAASRPIRIASFEAGPAFVEIPSSR